MKKGVKKKKKSSQNLSKALVPFILLVLALILIFNLTDFKVPLQSPSDPIIYLPLEGNAKDVSGNKNHGEIFNARSTDGQVGRALSFDESGDYVEIKNSEDINLEEFTLAAWIYVDEDAQSWRRIIGKYNNDYAGGNDRGWMMYLADTTAGYLRCRIDDDGEGDAISSLKDAIPYETWTHVACSFDGSKQRLYINGVEIKEEDATITIPQTPEPIRIGATGLGTDKENMYKGKIDEVYVFETALDETEIEALYNKEFEITGLPAGFKPALGYFNDVKQGTTSLWEADGTIYFSDNGVNYKQISDQEKLNQGIELDYKAITAFFHPYGTPPGRIGIFDRNGNHKMFGGPGDGQTGFIDITRESMASSGLPVEFNPTASFWKGYGPIVLINSSGDSYLARLGQNWQNFPVSEKDNFNLPEIAPELVYYYSFSDCPYIGELGDVNDDTRVDTIDQNLIIQNNENNLLVQACGDLDSDGIVGINDKTWMEERLASGPIPLVPNARIHRWYITEQGVKLYRSATTESFEDITSQLTGIPPNLVPDTGYYDKHLNKIVLWYGESAYGSISSGDSSVNNPGTNFELLYGEEVQDPGAPPECTTDPKQLQCEATEFCNDSNFCEEYECVDNSQCSTGEFCVQNSCEDATICVDADGFDLGTKTTTEQADGTEIGEDECDGSTLTEWFCDADGNGDSFDIECPNGCSQGKCLGTIPELICDDSDGGKDEDEFGDVEILVSPGDGQAIASYSDSCESDDEVEEWFCNSNEMPDKIIKNCGSDEECVAGRCVDEGSSPSTPGTGTTTCTTNQERCTLGNSVEICINGVWENLGRQEGECGYTSGTTPSAEITCTYDAQCDNDETCNDNGYCQLKSSESSGGLWLVIIIILIFIAIIVGAIIFIAIKNKNKSQNKTPGNVTVTHKKPSPPRTPPNTAQRRPTITQRRPTTIQSARPTSRTR